MISRSWQIQDRFRGFFTVALLTLSFNSLALDSRAYLAAVDEPSQLSRDSQRSDAQAGQAIKKDDRIISGNGGRVAIALGEDTDVFLASNSGVLIRQLHSGDADNGGLKGILTVEQGMVRINSRANQRPIHFRIEQKTLKADLRGPAKFMVNHNDGTDILCLFEGNLSVQANDDHRELKSPNTCFLYNGETKASSIRNMSAQQVQAVKSLTKVSAAPRQPLQAAPSLASNNGARVAPATVKTTTGNDAAKATKRPAVTAARPPAATSGAPATASQPLVEVSAAKNLLDMMRRPTPGQKLSEPNTQVQKRTVVNNRSISSSVVSDAEAVRETTPANSANASKPPATTMAKPAAVTQAAANRAATKTRPAATSPRRVAAAPKTYTANRTKTKAVAKKRYDTPSGRLEDWTINLAAYKTISDASGLVTELRELGYFPVLKAFNKNGTDLYRLSLHGLPSRIESEKTAAQIIAKTSASSYWLENRYLSP